MPSPFPGMDPFIESQEWSDFHARAMMVSGDLLTEQLPSGYAARVERRSYLEFEIDFNASETVEVSESLMVPDLNVFESASAVNEPKGSFAVAVATPTRCRLAQPIEQRETYLEIRDTRTRQVVTAIELLSPTNKRAGSMGSRIFAEKREAVLETQTHFVEIDLLRGGHRVLFTVPKPEGDYYALVSRSSERPNLDVYGWRLRDRLPTIRIPLKSEDSDVLLDLQLVLDTVYERTRYGNTIEYGDPLRPPLSSSDEAWVRPLLDRHLASRVRKQP